MKFWGRWWGGMGCEVLVWRVGVWLEEFVVFEGFCVVCVGLFGGREG